MPNIVRLILPPPPGSTGDNGRSLPVLVIELDLGDDSEMPPFMRHMMTDIVAEDRMG